MTPLVTTTGQIRSFARQCLTLAGLVILLPACAPEPGRPLAAADPEYGVAVRIDPQLELFSTIHRLAATGQYDEVMLPEYIAAVEAHFGPFRNHRAVHLARELRHSHHLDGNSPMGLAVYVGEPPELAPRAPLVPPPADLDPRWTSETISRFLEAARAFARDTEFMAFFTSHANLHSQAVRNLRATLSGAKLLPWFRDYFGDAPANFVVLIDLQNGTCNYAATVTFPDGHREFNAILGARDPDSTGVPRYEAEWFLPVVVHEFCHAYVNPLVDRHADRLRGAGEIIFPYHQPKLRQSGYNFWHVMMYEYLVRACVVRYLLAHRDEDDAGRTMRWDERAGFPHIRPLVTLLADYEARRDIYLRFEDFLPRVAVFFDQYAAEVGPPTSGNKLRE